MRRPVSMTDSSENNRLGGRIRRYARVGTAVGGLGGALRGRALSRPAARSRAACGRIEGGARRPQGAADEGGADPGDHSGRAAQGIRPASWRSCRPTRPPWAGPSCAAAWRPSLGPDWQRRFESFEHEAAHAASLGQVHRADRAGRRGCSPASCSIPTWQSAVEADLAPAAHHLLDLRALRPHDLHRRRSMPRSPTRLREELDYEREARHMALYGLMLKDEADVHVPEVEPKLSTRRLLTMSWLEGEPLLPFIATHPELAVRNQVALNMFRAWYVPFYFYGVIHGDPASRQLHGAAGRLDQPARFRLRPRLPAELRRGRDRSLPRAAATTTAISRCTPTRSWGFKGLNARGHRRAQPLGALRLRPADGRPRAPHPGLLIRHLRPRSGRGRASRAAPPRRRSRRRASSSSWTAPPSASARCSCTCKAEINWYRLFQELIEGFEVKAVEKRQAKALKAAKVPGAG